MNTARELKLGVSLFSLTNEWRMGKYHFESVLAALAERDLGPGLEIVGAQTIRGYPRLDRETARTMRLLMDKYHRVPTCLSSSTDVMRSRQRPMNDAEKIADLEVQMDVAVALGFPVMRIQIGLSEAVLQALAAVAERRGLRLGMEIHAPQGGNTPDVLRLREIYARIASPALGFIPDFSSTMRAVPQGQVAAFVKAGLPEALGRQLVASWARDELDLHARFADFEQIANAANADPARIGEGRLIFHMFGRQPVETWRPLLAQTFHVHAKYYSIDAEGNEPAIPYAALMAQFRDHGYHGWFSSEWEGSAFMLSTEVDAMDLLVKHHALMRRSWM